MLKIKPMNINSGYLFVFLQNILFGFGDPLSKIAYAEMSVYSVISVRFTLAFLVLLLIGRKELIDEIRSTGVRVWILPSVSLGLAYILGNVALDFAPATSVAFLRSLSTVFTPFLAYLVFRTRFRRIHLACLGAIVVGLYLLCGAGGMNGFGLGEIIALGCALLLAVSLVFSSEALRRVNAMTITTIQVGVSAALSIACALLFEGSVSMAGASMESWGVVLYLAVFCSVAGFLLQNKALERTSPRSVALVQCACPVCTAICSYFILGERLSVVGIAGVIIILLCVIAETIME